MAKYVHFTHTDLDGIGCAILSRIAFGNDVEITFVNYSDVNETIKNTVNNTANFLITDISVNAEVAELLNNNTEVVLLDHHATALALNEYSWANVVTHNSDGLMTSGTELYYNWLCESGHLSRTAALDRLVQIVRDRDTWRWTEMGEDGVICKQLNDLMFLYGRKKFIEWAIDKVATGVFEFSDAEKFILEIREKELADYINAKEDEMTFITLCERPCAVVFAERFFSELGTELCKRHPEIDFVAMVNPKGCVSYRSIKDDIDLGKIAKVYGGGGHPKAAGSMFNKTSEIISLIFG